MREQRLAQVQINQINGCRAVAASDVNKYARTPPLQDNVEIWLNSLKAAYPWTEIMWQHDWINIKHKLISLIALAFSVLFDQVCFTALSACTFLKQCSCVRKWADTRRLPPLAVQTQRSVVERNGKQHAACV